MTTDRKKPGVAFWATVLLVAGSYAGAYLALVVSFDTEPAPRTTEAYCWPSGQLIGYHAFWRRVFQPAHALDRIMRPNVWRD